MIYKNTFILYIIFTLNNIFYILLNLDGKIIIWISIGQFKNKGLKKLTINSIKNGLLKILKHSIFLQKNLINVHIKLKGFHKYKKIVLKYLKQLNYKIVSISDETTLPHNGCKKKKKKYL